MSGSYGCTHLHRSYTALAECIWPTRAWAHIPGDGRYAVVSKCQQVTVSLHQALADAMTIKAGIDRTQCGHICNPANHHVVKLPIGHITKAAMHKSLVAIRDRARALGVPDTDPIPEELL